MTTRPGLWESLTMTDEEWHRECNRRSDANMAYYYTECARCGHERSRHEALDAKRCTSDPFHYTDVTTTCDCPGFVEPEDGDE